MLEMGTSFLSHSISSLTGFHLAQSAKPVTFLKFLRQYLIELCSRN